MDVRELIPKHKNDDSNIEILRTINQNEIQPILEDLLKWLQDINWPVAQILIEILPRFQTDLIPYIIDVFHSDDDIWKNWVLCLIKEFDEDTVLFLLPEIKRIINNPTKGEIIEETIYYAGSIIEKFKL